MTRSQIAPECLETLETVTKEVLNILSPGTSLLTTGSLFNQRWRLPEELPDSGLFITHHPAFLPHIVRYLGGLGLSEEERQAWWRAIDADRCQELRLEPTFESGPPSQQVGRIPHHQFYRSSSGMRAGAAAPHISEDLETFHSHLGGLLPALKDFLATFQPALGPPPSPCSRPALSVLSQNTQYTASSGVSSFVPKTTRKQTEKRKSFVEPEPRRQQKKRKD